MTHSYYDKGSQFDHEGQLNNWWSKEDKEKFMEKADYYVKEYGSCKINGKNVNGELTLGENLADHGGVKIAFHALKTKLRDKNTILEKSKFTPMQRFFISWAIVWRCNITDEEADKRLLTDPHSPNVLRINCTLRNIPEFHEVFNIDSGDMYREDPVQMW